MPIRDYLTDLLRQVLCKYKVFSNDNDMKVDDDDDDESIDDRIDLPFLTVGNKNTEHLFRNEGIDNRQVIQKLIKERERERDQAIKMNQDILALQLIMGCTEEERKEDPQRDGLLVSDTQGVAWFRVFPGYNYTTRDEIVKFSDVYGKIVYVEKQHHGGGYTYWPANHFEDNLRRLLGSLNDFPRCAKMRVGQQRFDANDHFVVPMYCSHRMCEFECVIEIPMGPFCISETNKSFPAFTRVELHMGDNFCRHVDGDQRATMRGDMAEEQEQNS
eukprot:5659_1